MKKTLLLMGMAAGLFSAACEQAKPIETEQVIRPAKLVYVTTGDEVRSLRLPATVAAKDTSTLTFQVSGLLQELQIQEGSVVERDQILATLDQRSFRNDVASAQADFENAEAEFGRAERLIAENAISQSILEQRRSARDVASAALDTARKRLDDTILRAPFSGVVAEIYIESFENIAAQQSVLTLQSEGDSEAIVQVPASIVVNADRMEPVDVYLELDALPDVRLPAEFVEGASIADATTQTFEARFSFALPVGENILPGMTGILVGRFRTPFSDQGTASQMSIPLASVLAESGDSYVWLVDPDSMTVTQRSVQVSPGPDDMVFVNSGLSDGDIIVGAGGAYLFEGAKIRAYEE